MNFCWQHRFKYVFYPPKCIFCQCLFFKLNYYFFLINVSCSFFAVEGVFECSQLRHFSGRQIHSNWFRWQEGHCVRSYLLKRERLEIIWPAVSFTTEYNTRQSELNNFKEKSEMDRVYYILNEKCDNYCVMNTYGVLIIDLDYFILGTWSPWHLLNHFYFKKGNKTMTVYRKLF